MFRVGFEVSLLIIGRHLIISIAFVETELIFVVKIPGYALVANRQASPSKETGRKVTFFPHPTYYLISFFLISLFAFTRTRHIRHILLLSGSLRSRGRFHNHLLRLVPSTSMLGTSVGYLPQAKSRPATLPTQSPLVGQDSRDRLWGIEFCC